MSSLLAGWNLIFWLLHDWVVDFWDDDDDDKKRQNFVHFLKKQHTKKNPNIILIHECI